jgi:hypothetical protein
MDEGHLGVDRCVRIDTQMRLCELGKYDLHAARGLQGVARDTGFSETDLKLRVHCHDALSAPASRYGITR